MGPIQRRLVRGVLRVVAYPKATLAVALLLVGYCSWLAATRLTISTDQDKLFSPNVKFFHDYLEFNRKFPENEALYVLIEPTDPAHPPAVPRWTGVADEVAHRLEALKQYVEYADSHVPLEKLGRQGILFLDPAKLPETFDQSRRMAPLAQLWGGKPSTIAGLLGRTPMQRFLAGVALQSPDEETAGFVGLLARSWTRTIKNPDRPVKVGSTVPDLMKTGADDPGDLGYYYVPDETNPSRRLLLVKVYTVENNSSLSAGDEQVAAIRAVIDQIKPRYPEFKIGITGRPALDADEMHTTDVDTHYAEICSCIVVFIGLAVMLRSIWLALVAEIALGFGIGWTFGYATIAVGELNLLSIIFLIALIGIGMDYLIQILTRYRREARRYPRAAAVWARVFRYVSPPITTACLGAAGAFFVSVFTDFRGAADLGIIAGGGLLLCLLAGYTVLPAILVLFPPKLKEIDPAERYAFAPPVGSTTLRRLLIPAVWVVMLALVAPFATRANFNPNLLDMQADNRESVKLVRKLQTWSAVVLSKDLGMLRRVRGAVENAPTVAGTESILGAYDNYEWLQKHRSELPQIEWTDPVPLVEADLPRLAEQAKALAAKLEAVPATAPSATTHPAWAVEAAASLRAFAEALTSAAATQPAQVAKRLSDWQTVFVAELRDLLANLTPPPLDLAQVPPQVRDHFVSADGDYALYINPKEDLWKREPLARFVTDVEAHVATVPGAPAPTGIAPDIYHTTRSIEQAFYKATFYALLLVVVLVYIDLRNVRQTLLTVSVLALGLPMLVGLMGLIGVDWNFANFFGLPILIGAGHEYGVFMVHRYREALHNPRRVWRNWDVSDRALLLCAFVTSSSFGFFWILADHKGLKSLGLVMALGTACIYLAATLVVRPLLKWRLDRLRLDPALPVEGAFPVAASRTGV